MRTRGVDVELKRINFEVVDTSKIIEMAKKLETIFQYNLNTDKTSYLNWRTSYARTPRRQFVTLGEAFFSTAYNLIQQCLYDNGDKKADSWIFPIMFSIIHGIEVYLKAINAALRVVLNEKEEQKISAGGHDIRVLCINAKSKISQLKTTYENSTAEEMFQGIKLVENFIKNIYEKTNDMTFVRYPLEKNEQGHFYIENLENEVINLEVLAEQVVYVYSMLEYIYDNLELDLEIRSEAISEMMSSY